MTTGRINQIAIARETTLLGLPGGRNRRSLPRVEGAVPVSGWGCPSSRYRSFVRAGQTRVVRHCKATRSRPCSFFFDAPIRHPPPGQISSVPSGRVRSKIIDRPFIVPSEPSSRLRTACEHRAVLPGRRYLARETGRQAPRIDRLHQPRRHLPILVLLHVNLGGKAKTVGVRLKKFSKFQTFPRCLAGLLGLTPRPAARRALGL